MNKTEILNRYYKEEDRLLVAKILDKIEFAKKKNQIVCTDFLNMYQKKISQDILNVEKYKYYIYYTPYEESSRCVLIIYPEKYSEIFENDRFNYSSILT